MLETIAANLCLCWMLKILTTVVHIIMGIGGIVLLLQLVLFPVAMDFVKFSGLCLALVK